MSSDVVIRVEGLSKQYVLGRRDGGRGLRHVLDDFVRAPKTWFSRTMRSSSTDVRAADDVPFYALRDVSFEVMRGDVFGIVGRNGSGKSTLLKILSRIVEPTHGRAAIKGRIASLLEVGTGFHPELTGRENIFLNGAILGMTRAQITRRFDEIVAFADVERFLDTPVKRYSSGMYLRLAFAVAAHLESEVLVIDEVLAVGDAAFQQKCIGKMDEMAHRDGRTVLFVSHNLGAVQRLCNAALLLEQGRIKCTGSSADVVARYIALDGNAQSEGPYRSGPAVLDVQADVAEGVIRNTVSMGQAVRFSIRLEVDRPVRQASIGIGVEATTGERILTFDTTLQYGGRWEVEREAQLVLDWPECNLCPGTYRFVAALYDNAEPVAVWYDAGTLTVLEADYFGTGEIPDPRHQGKVFTPARWHVAASEAGRDA